MNGLGLLDYSSGGGPGPQGPPGPGVINWRGAYDNDATYEVNDAVSYNGASYIAILETTGNLPTDTDFWDVIAEKGDTGAAGTNGEDGLDINWRRPYDNGTAYVVNDAVEYEGSSYIATAPTAGNLPTDTNFWDLMASKGDQGDQGIQGEQGEQGEQGFAAGGAITILYTISDQEENSDPGDGLLRLNDFASQNAVTAIRADDLDVFGTDWSAVLVTLDDSSSTIKGHIRLVHATDRTKWLLFTVSVVGGETGYKNITVVNVGASGTAPFANADPILLTFTRTGDKGETGATGDPGDDGLSITWRGAYDNGTMYAINDAVEYQGSSYIATAPTIGNLPTDTDFWDLMAAKGDQGDQGEQGETGETGAHGGAITIEYTFDDTTTDSDPGNGLLRLSHATQNTSTAIRADHLDTNGTDCTTVLTSLDDSTSTVKGQIRLFRADDQSKWLLFNVSAAGSETGYKNITVANVDSSEDSPFANGDPVILAFTRTGDKGETGSQGDQGPQGDPGEDGLDITWCGAYDNGTMYAINDAVEYQGSSYIATAPTIGNLPTDADFWDLMAQKGDTGDAGTDGDDGEDGAFGGAVTLEYVFDSDTTNSVPGDGNLRLNQSTQNTATAIYVDNQDVNVTTHGMFPTWDDSTSTIKGHIRISHKFDSTKWLLFTTTGRTGPAGYNNIAGSIVSSSAASPFSHGDPILIHFDRTGDKGDTGSSGSTGTQGQHGGGVTISYTFSTTTTDSDPGSGNLRFDNATQSSATVIRADLLDSGGADWTDVLDSLDDSTSIVKGHLRLVHATDFTKWILFTVSAVASETGYRNITVSVVDSSAASPFSNSDPILLTFTRTGDQGASGLTGNPGQDGADGRHGGAVTIEYTFSTTTADADPGNGKLRLNQATQNTATMIRADLLDRLGTTWTNALDTFDDSTSTVKGFIRLVRADDASKWLLFSVSALSSPSGYRNITVSNVASSENNPFVNSDIVLLTFSRNGDKGDTGNTGATGAAGAHGGAVTINYTFSTTTTDSDPGNGNLRLDNATQSSATIIRVDLLDTLGSDWTDAIDNLASPIPPPIGTNPQTGHIRLVHKTDLTKWILFNLDGVETQTGYRNLYVTYIDSSATSPFSNSDQLVLAYTRNGVDGDNGFPGANGQDGLPGGAIAIQYTFSTTTADSDPGNGNLRLNNATQSSATVIRTDLLDAFGTTVTGVLDSLDDSGSGQIRLQHISDATKWLIFNLTSIATPSGYRNITVSLVSSSASSPFSNGDLLVLMFTPAGTSVVIDVFTSNGTWTKRAGAKVVEGVLIGGGGGGGSGRKGGSGNNRAGGAGGGGGGYTPFKIQASLLGATESVTRGAGGVGGAAQTGNTTDGNTGQPGGTTSFGSWFSAAGGDGGVGGDAGSVLNPGASGGFGLFSGAQGGDANNTAGGDGRPSSSFGGAGGGAGGGTGGTASNAGGAGGSNLIGNLTGGTAGATTPTNGGNGNNATANLALGGAGGGGGGFNNAGPATTGGNGGLYGGGGGGGSGGRDSLFDSGAGGNGANGIAVVITYF